MQRFSIASLVVVLLFAVAGCNSTEPTQVQTHGTSNIKNGQILSEWTCTGTFTDLHADPIRPTGLTTSEISDSVSNGWIHTTTCKAHTNWPVKKMIGGVITVQCGDIATGEAYIWKDDAIIFTTSGTAPKKEFSGEICIF